MGTFSELSFDLRHFGINVDMYSFECPLVYFLQRGRRKGKEGRRQSNSTFDIGYPA